MDNLSTTSPCICSISLHHSDLLRLHNFPGHLSLQLQSAVQNSWARGIQAVQAFHSSMELKLKGNPWSDSWHPVESLKLVLMIIEFMATRGWNLLTVTSVGSQFYTKDTWIFQFKEQPAGTGSIRLSALSFHGSDKIRVVASDGSLAGVVETALQHYWSRGIQEKRFNDGVPELKLRGTPWRSTGKENDQVHGFLTALIDSLNAHGYKFLTSARITQTSSREQDRAYLPLDNWILLNPSSPTIGYPSILQARQLDTPQSFEPL